MTRPARQSFRLDVSDAVPLPGHYEIAASVVRPGPEAHDPALPLLSCLPGGFLTRGYYDMEVEGDRSYSFAEHLAGHGFTTLAFDHLGVGESTRPDPERGFELGVEDFARADALALDRLIETLGLPAQMATVGIGHSMGSCLSVVQQAMQPRHRGLVLYSFSTAGLPAFITEHEAAAGGDGEALCGKIGDLAKTRFGSPWPEGEGGAQEGSPHVAFQVGTAPDRALDALRKVSTAVLAVPGLTSMIPRGYAPWAERVACPILVAAGDHDLGGLEHVPAELPRSEVDTLTLDDCWHCHFVANPRVRLWDATADWLRTRI